jgi:hypothetical protein
MADQLIEARRLADAIRFSGDLPAEGAVLNDDGSLRLRSFFQHNELLISEAVTPTLYGVLAAAASRLCMCEEQIEAYVYADPQIQASCMVRGADRCLIRLSSGLVTLLSPDELAFVVGHEVGHHLLRHSKHAIEQASAEYLMAKRAGEISADRLGLIACGCIETAIRALMKSLSGLPDQMIRFDVGRYLTQFGDNALPTIMHPQTHPSMAVRCRALLWFASAPSSLAGTLQADDKRSVDGRVARDLVRFIDAEIHEEIEMAEHQLALWMAVEAIVADGRLSRLEREWLGETFGPSLATRVVSLLSDQSSSDALRVASERSASALDVLRRLVPSTWQERQRRAQALVSRKPH